MVALLIRLLSTLFLSRVIQEIATGVLLVALKRWSLYTDNTWDDEMVAVIEKALVDPEDNEPRS